MPTRPLSPHSNNNSQTLSSPLYPLPSELLALSTSQWLFHPSDLHRTPSILRGLPPAKERENRIKGVNFILQVGIMLKLPQPTLATASIFLHRFFMRWPMDVPGQHQDKQQQQQQEAVAVGEEGEILGGGGGNEEGSKKLQGQHYYSVAAATLFLATKVEEDCRKIKELVVACVKVAQKNPNLVVDEQDKEFWRWRDTILSLEDVLLETLCFDLSVTTPYKTLISYLHYLGYENDKKLRNTAWAILNDSSMTMMCLVFESSIIAASALYAAARHCGIKFLDGQDGRPWWERLGVELREVKKGVNFLAEGYEARGGRGEMRDVYQYTPEEEAGWKTREERETGPEGERIGESMTGEVGFEEGGLGERKRSAEGEVQDDIKEEETARPERSPKRRRMVTNGSANGKNSLTNGTVGYSEEKELGVRDRGGGITSDDVEEGELEA